MGIRDNLELLHRFYYFSQLRPEENEALGEFNLALEAYLDQMVADTARNFHKIAGRSLVLTPEKITKIKKDTLHQLKTTGYQHIPVSLDKHLGAISKEGLIRLALHPEGEHFYHYLNDVISEEAKNRTNNHSPTLTNEYQSKAELYEYLNTLTTTELTERLKYGKASANSFYDRIESFCPILAFQAEGLLYMDGKAVDCICSVLLHNLLDDQNREYRFPKKDFTLEEKREIQDYAARNGCYDAAHNLIKDFARTLRKGETMKDSIAFYEQCQVYVHQHLIPHYKTAGYLLMVELLQSLRCLNDKLDTDGLTDEYVARDELIAIDMYHTLVQASKHENRCKNVLRLAFMTDDSVSRLSYLAHFYKLYYGIMSSVNKSNQQDLSSVSYPDFLIYYRNRYKHLISRFEQPAITPEFIERIKSQLSGTADFPNQRSNSPQR